MTAEPSAPQVSEAPTGAPRVLIRTLPLKHGNYGGILQAYALQTALRERGVPAVTDAPVRFRRSVRTPVGTAVAALRGRFDERLTPEMKNATNARLLEFIDAHLTTVESVADGGVSRRELLEDVSVAIAGSDQVWRHSYGDVRRYLFADLPAPGIRRISFAASFGRDEIDEYPPALVHQTATLARHFAGVSVREASGVEICRRHWSVTAQQHLDPVFLLDATRYRELLAGVPAVGNQDSLFAYVLDLTPAKTVVLERVAAALRLRLRVFTPPAAPTRSGLRRSPEASVKASMAQWLSGIADAGFVVTDSFHGAAMSIILNRPYLALVNADRGAARFDSLHTVLGLTDRLVTEHGAGVPGAAFAPIDWARVERVIRAERERSLGYLAEHVPGLAEPRPPAVPRAG